jgi:hypothetical protein
MAERDEANLGETPGEIQGEAGDVVAGSVTIRQGGARSVRAREISIHQGGAVRMNADQVSVTQGGILLARTDSAQVTAGAVAVVAARGEVDLKASAAKVVLSRDEVELEHSAAVAVVAREAEISDSAVGILIARNVDAKNVRVMFGVKEALAFGAAAGAVLWLLATWRRR